MHANRTPNNDTVSYFSAYDVSRTISCISANMAFLKAFVELFHRAALAEYQ